MTKQKNTKLRWDQPKYNNLGKYYEIDTEDGRIEIYGANKKATAQFIIQACNTHYELVDLLLECSAIIPRGSIDEPLYQRVGAALEKAGVK